MAAREIFNQKEFKNYEENGKLAGFSFQFKAQYYRGFTLSILRDIQIKVDDIDIPREDVAIVINGECFSLEETRTVVDPNYRWEFGEFATVKCRLEGGLKAGKHHIEALQIIAPSYMPFEIKEMCMADFEI